MMTKQAKKKLMRALWNEYEVPKELLDRALDGNLIAMYNALRHAIMFGFEIGILNDKSTSLQKVQTTTGRPAALYNKAYELNQDRYENRLRMKLAAKEIWPDVKGRGTTSLFSRETRSASSRPVGRALLKPSSTTRCLM